MNAPDTVKQWLDTPYLLTTLSQPPAFFHLDYDSARRIQDMISQDYLALVEHILRKTGWCVEFVGSECRVVVSLAYGTRNIIGHGPDLLSALLDACEQEGVG